VYDENYKYKLPEDFIDENKILLYSQFPVDKIEKHKIYFMIA
jgi:hypothetical protein